MDNKHECAREITKKISRMLMSVCFLLAIGCRALAQKVTVDADKGADFAKYKTYAFAKATSAGNPMIHQRIIAQLEILTFLGRNPVRTAIEFR